MLKRTITTAAIVLAGLQLLAGSAHAGRYHVYTCRTPAGEPAPTDGWVGSVAAGGAFDDYARNTCAEGGALIAALGDQTSHLSNVDRASWAFEAPSFDQVVGESLFRSGYVHGRSSEPATYQFWFAAPVAKKIFDECVYSLGCASQGDPAHPVSSANSVTVPSANVGSHLSVSASCSGGIEGAECGGSFSDPNGFAAAVYLFGADITLEQTAGPSVTAVHGDLADAATVTGTSPLLFGASDPGSGVYAAVFAVDGSVVQRTVIDENGGRCRDVGHSADSLPAFLYLQPCKASLSADVGLDTAALANGAHHLVVSVTDAAGNTAPVLDRTITVANSSLLSAPGAGSTAGTPGTALPGTPNGANASGGARLVVSWKGSKASRLTSAYGRALTIEGRLTDASGSAISGALVEASDTAANTGAATLAMAPVRTGSDGRFTVRLARGVSSRTIRFAYRAHLGDVSPAATGTLALAVRAGVSLSIKPRVARVGRSIAFHGRLLGAPVPRGGKQLVLEARSPGGRWIVFNVIRTRPNGQFRASYRFRFPGPATYQFRVYSEAEADYPYAAGDSNTVVVRER